jgi:IS1 family transposase
MWHHLVWYKFNDISDEYAAYVLGSMSKQTTKKIMQSASATVLSSCFVHHSTLNTGQYVSPKRR